MNFIFSCSTRYLTRRREISNWPLEDKIHIHARACNILYVFFQWTGKRHVMWRFFWYISLYRCSNEPSAYWRVPCQRFHWQVEIQICSQYIGLQNFNSVNEVKITSLGALVIQILFISLFSIILFFEDFKTVEFRDKTMSWNICWTQRCRPLFEGKKTVDNWFNITPRAVFKRLSKTPQKSTIFS